MFYLMMNSTHFNFGYMALGIAEDHTDNDK